MAPADRRALAFRTDVLKGLLPNGTRQITCLRQLPLLLSDEKILEVRMPARVIETGETTGRLREREEAVRLAYVATTRARDLLVIPGNGEGRSAERKGATTWLEMLDDTIYPAPGQARESEQPNGCPDFGSETVLNRPADKATLIDGSVKPGLHRPRVGGHDIVWWDPATLDLAREGGVGIRQQYILEVGDGQAPPDQYQNRFLDWQSARGQAISSGAKETHSVVTATNLARELGRPTQGDRVTVLEVSVDRTSRPGGRRFGTLVHAALATVPLDGDATDVRSHVASQARLTGSDPAEIEAAVTAVTAALDHPVIREAAASGRVLREVPVAWLAKDGRIVEGIADLVFRRGDGWSVVDFKTDREVAGALEEYKAQIELYGTAVAKATGHKVDSTLLLL